MNTEDEAYERLVAADPAAGTASRPEVLRAKTDTHADEASSATSSATDGTAETDPLRAGSRPDDDLSSRRARPRATWLVAAAVVGALAIGGGGYALGSSGAGTTTAGGEAADDALPPITLGDVRGGAEGAQDAAGAADGEALARTESGDDAATADVALPGWYEGRSVFSASGLSAEAGTATAYAYDARDVGTQEAAARLAETLGVSGETRWEWGAWNVGPRDGDGPSVWLSADGTGTFSFNDPAADPWRCADEPVETMEREDTGDGQDMIEPAPCDAPGDPQLSPQDAIDEVRALMERLDVDPDGFAFEAPDDGGEGAVWVSAQQEVDGQETGTTWSATVGDEGIAWLDGFLAQTVPLGDYPVVSPADAVERLGDPRFGGSSWPVAYAAESEAMLEERWAEEDGSEPTPPPAPPASGDALPWPVSEVTITEARLGLTRHHDASGSVLLLPAYELSDAAGNTWSVLAVAEEGLDTTSS
ncbi:hypothetical protein UQW22_08530 [Isoptericola halotolerans]|uniref:hypothetical protein n=1 Tax=Isoptericola halotolerans TaxID=300560 RepID=UPI0038907A80